MCLTALFFAFLIGVSSPFRCLHQEYLAPPQASPHGKIQENEKAMRSFYLPAAHAAIRVVQYIKGRKAAALLDYLRTNNLNPQYVHYFGDEFFTEGDADAPILTIPGVHAYAVCPSGENGYQGADGRERRAVRIGDNYKAIHELLRFLYELLNEQKGLLRQL